MVARARATSEGIAVLLDPEIVLLPSFIDVLRHFCEFLRTDWLLFATSMTVSDFPYYLGSHWFKHSGEATTAEEVQDYVRWSGEWLEENRKAFQLWAWNSGKTPLHAGVLPPFSNGAGFHNDWLLNETLASNLRAVFDVSEAVRSFAKLQNDQQEQSGDGFLMSWKSEGNAHLAQRYGSYALKKTSNVPVKLGSCGSQLCFLRNVEDRHHSYEMSLMRNATDEGELDSFLQQKPRSGNFSWKNSFTNSSYMEILLRQIASRDRVVILTVVSNSYRDMLMSWVCRLRQLNITNFIVAAVDEDLYRFGVLLGLPIFGAGASISDSALEDCSFGSRCFQKVTKLKSKTVLRVLELGYHVLFSDVDVYWFSSPIEELMSFGRGTLAAQTDEYNETEAVNVPRRLNSGFYFAWSDEATIGAFRKIVIHAAKSKLSEQPSFYDVLCGEGGVYREGETMCREPESNLSVRFLDRLRYPNGGYRLIWESRDVRRTCSGYGCVVLHNNWKTGSVEKTQRQMTVGLWEYDAESRMCRWPWQNENSRHIF